MALISHFNLSSVLNNIDGFDNDFDNDFDVTIKVGENENMKEFKAHSVILRARSPYFKSAFKASWIIKKDNMIEFCKPNITPNAFNMILK
jgi:hypothetical protein